MLRCPQNFGSIFQAFSRVKCNITFISLLLEKYTRTFVPRFPGIPEILYFCPPSASGNITSRGFPGTSGQTFWYISLKAMTYLYNICSGINIQQANSKNCGPPPVNKFDLEIGQRSRSQSSCIPNINALSLILQKIRTRLKFL